MGTRADFYIGVNKPVWIGSIHQDGEPWFIPCKILVQNNATMYEETVVDFLTMKKGIIESIGDHWPWPWEDSRLTDYSYFFSKKYGAVYAYSRTDKVMFYPLKIMQGDDLKTARVLIMANFPMMGVGYGSNATKVI
jgi:hypothetical protein